MDCAPCRDVQNMCSCVHVYNGIMEFAARPHAKVCLTIDILTPGLETERRAHKFRCNTPCLNSHRMKALSLRK